jgi:hypothetical protein
MLCGYSGAFQHVSVLLLEVLGPGYLTGNLKLTNGLWTTEKDLGDWATKL